MNFASYKLSGSRLKVWIVKQWTNGAFGIWEHVEGSSGLWDENTSWFFLLTLFSKLVMFRFQVTFRHPYQQGSSPSSQLLFHGICTLEDRTASVYMVHIFKFLTHMAVKINSFQKWTLRLTFAAKAVLWSWNEYLCPCLSLNYSKKLKTGNEVWNPFLSREYPKRHPLVL